MARYGTHVLVILTIRAKILDQPTNVFEEENKKTSLRLYGFIPELVVLDIRIKASQRFFFKRRLHILVITNLFQRMVYTSKK